jgi:hypothetical protein
MGKSKWDEASALACLGRCRVKVSGRLIDPTNAGIRCQGATDYLCNNRGYMRSVSDRQIQEAIKNKASDTVQP